MFWRLSRVSSHKVTTLLVRISSVAFVLTGAPPQAAAQSLVCHTIMPGDTAAQVALRLTGQAGSRHQPWFHIVDPTRSTVISKARYDVIIPGWQACIPRALLRNAPSPPTTPVPIAQRLGTRDLMSRDRAIALAYVCWGIAALCAIVLGWQTAEQYVQKRRTLIGHMRRFGVVFVRDFERPLVRGGVADRPIRARLRCAVGHERLDILLAPSAGRRYPNLGDHRQNVEYDVDRIAQRLRHEPFVRKPLHAEGPWVVIPFQFKPDLKQGAVQ